MKQIFVIVIGLAVVFQVHAQEKKPFSFEAYYIGDAVYNLNGGIKTGSTYLGMANFMIGLDIEKADFWKGGELFLNAANTHGGEPSATLIGDYQVASNIEAGDLTYLQELWFRQSIGKVSVIFGLQDLAVEFLSTESTGLYLNSSFGVHSTIATNLLVPIFPLTALGAQLHYNINDNLSFKVAAFDGVPEDFSTNTYNLDWKLSKNEGYISFYELTFNNPSTSVPGNYKLGAYYHNSHTASQDQDDITISEKQPENYGLYLVIDQSILKNQSGQELSFFTQASLSPKNINDNWYYIGAGLNYKGIFSKRTDDILGIACAHSGINNEIGSETALELTYKAQLGENFFIQPNFQYIINLAGTDAKLENSMVGFMRFGINF